MTPAEALPPGAFPRRETDAEGRHDRPSLAGRVLKAMLPVVKLRTQLRGISLGVRVWVRDERSRVLLIRHSYLPGWHFPGGGVEFGEDAADAARREVAEEGGVLMISPPQLIGLFRNPEWTRGDHVAFFKSEDWRPCPTQWGAEIDAAAFFPEQALPSDVHPSVRRRLDEAAGAPQAAIW